MNALQGLMSASQKTGSQNPVTITVKNPSATDYGLLANITPQQLQQAIDARKAGSDVILKTDRGGDIFDQSVTNPILDEMIATNAPVHAGTFQNIGLKTGGITISGSSLGTFLGGLALMGGVGALGGAFGGAGAAGGAAGAAGVTPEMAAMGLGEAVPSAGGFLGADLATGAAGAAGAGSAITGMSNEAIGNALMSGQYGGMTGPLTASEAYNAVIAGGGSAADAAAAAASVGTGIGTGSTSLLNNLGIGGGTAGAAGSVGSALTGGGSTLGNLANAGLGLYSQYQAGQTAKDIAAQNAALQKPWLEAGTNALAEIMPGIKPGGEFRKDYTVSDYQQDPYNKWLQSQGTQAITRSAAAKGTLGSGNVLADLAKYNQNVAGAGFADQWNREQTGTANKFNRLASVAQLGQQAPANTMAGNAFAASEGAKSKIGMTNTLANLFNSNWQGA